MKLSLPSILTFVALAHAKFHAVRSPSTHPRAQAAFSPSVSKGKQSNKNTRLGNILTPRLSAVIAQMFEWTWDSVAAECATFLGPAGYAFVQGEHSKP